jgi:dethiobiotin synthetase
MRTWVITGTDTSVGKSLVTACLAEAARRTGASVRAVKPIASGVTAGTPGDDATLLGLAGGHPPLAYAAFAAPLSPHRAAELEGRAVSPDALLAWLEAIPADVLLVEGAGGWRVPWHVRSDGSTWELSDLSRHLRASVLVVAADRLGVLNHTRLTVDAIVASGHDVVGVVLNRGVPSDSASRATNEGDLRRLLAVPIATMAAIDPDDPDARADAGAALWSVLRPPTRADAGPSAGSG